MSHKIIAWAVGGLIAAFLALAFLGNRIAQKHVAIELAALRTGLLRCYEAAAPGPGGIVSPEKMKAVIEGDLSAPIALPHLLPSFVKSGDVSFPKKAVQKGSHEIICVVRLGDTRYYALKADRDCTVLNQANVDAWERTQ